MLGAGHMIYGPKIPEETVVQSKAVDLGIKAVVAANPSSTAVTLFPCRMTTGKVQRPKRCRSKTASLLLL